VGTILLVVLTILLALARILGLGLFPLGDEEALHALGALQETPTFWEGLEEPISSSALYQLLTNVVFQILGTTAPAARVVSSLASVLILVLVIALIPNLSVGRKLIFLLLLGTSPILLTTGRTAGGESLASLLVFVVMLLWLGQTGNPGEERGPWIIVSLGLAMTIGLPILKALMGWLFALGLSLILERGWGEHWNSVAGIVKHPSIWLAPLISIMVLAGFGSSLEGFRSFSLSLEQWLSGWIRPSGYSVIELVWLLLRAEPVLLFFGILGAIQAWRNDTKYERILTFWALGAGAFAILYLGREPGDLIWLVLPLSFLAVEPLHMLLISIQNLDSKLELVGLIGLLSTFTASGLLSLIAYGTGNVITLNPDNPNLVLVLFLALGLMAISVLIFFGIGWSWKLVLQSLGVMALATGLSLSASTLWRLNFSNQHDRVTELWSFSAPAPGLTRLVGTLEQTALAYSGDQTALPVSPQAEMPPSLIWALHDFERVEPGLAFGMEAPPVILAPEFDATASLPAEYIGQSLGVRKLRAWESMLPPNMLAWLVNRDAPVVIERWVLWARIDIASFGEIGVEPEGSGEGQP
jgi:hypothetical protein